MMLTVLNNSSVQDSLFEDESSPSDYLHMHLQVH